MKTITKKNVTKKDLTKKMEIKVYQNPVPIKKGAKKVVFGNNVFSSKFVNRYISAMQTLSTIKKTEINAVTASTDRILAMSKK